MGYTYITVKDLQKKLGVGRNKAYEIIKMPGALQWISKDLSESLKSCLTSGYQPCSRSLHRHQNLYERGEVSGRKNGPKKIK